MDINEILDSFSELVGKEIECTGILHWISRNPDAKVYISNGEGSSSVNLLIDPDDFHHFLAPISFALQRGTGLTPFKHEVTLTGTLIEQLDQTLAVEKVSKFVLTHPHHLAEKLNLTSNFFEFTSYIDYEDPELRLKGEEFRITTYTKFSLLNASSVIHQVSSGSDYQSLLGETITIKGQFFSQQIPYPMVAIDDADMKLEIDLRKMFALLRECVDHYTGGPMWPYEYEFVGKLVEVSSKLTTLGNPQYLTIIDLEAFTVKESFDY